MSVKLAKRLIEPDHWTCPHGVRQRPLEVLTYGPEVADVCTTANFEPDAQQELCLDLIFAIQADGLPACFAFCVICCRQNMKTGVLKQAAIGWLYVTEEWRITWSAHEMGTTRESHQEISSLIQKAPSLSRLLPSTPNHGIYDANGQERVELATGQILKFKARTLSGGRGLAGDKTILDEAFALKASHVGALIPTMMARPHGQVLYASSAGKADSDVLRDVRDRGRAGSSPRLSYVEWLAPKVDCETKDCAHPKDGSSPGCALDREDLRRKANPTVSTGRITMQTIADMRQELPPEEYARECLGWWDEPEELVEVFGPGKWGACAVDEEPMPTEGVTVGIAVSIDRLHTSLGAALKGDDGRVLVGAVKRASRTDWVVDEVVRIYTDRKALFVLDGHGPSADLIDDLVEAGVPRVELDKRGRVPNKGGLLVANTGQILDACASIFDQVDQKVVAHMSHDELDDAIRGAVKRDVGDRWAWGRKKSASDVSMLEAVTIADWGACLTRKKSLPVGAYA